MFLINILVKHKHDQTHNYKMGIKQEYETHVKKVIKQTKTEKKYFEYQKEIKEYFSC